MREVVSYERHYKPDHYLVAPCGAFLTQIAETPDLETALWKVLSDYIDLKIGLIKQRIWAFESKWKMSFAEFSERCEAESLDQDAYAYEVESDSWEWEKAETLLQHYVCCIWP